jgi:hypothetical protein
MRTAHSSLFARFQGLSATRRTLLIILGMCTGLLLLSWIGRPTNHKINREAPEFLEGETMGTNVSPDADLKAQWQRIKEMPRAMIPAAPGPTDSAGQINDGPGYTTPLIAHAAELAVGTKDFAHSRSALEEILERHHSYAAKLRMVGQPSGSVLTASLRVPSSEFNEMVTDLKGLGNVEREEQTADEVTQRHADLEARLKNAQNTLAHLKGMLEQGWKAGDPASIQRQLSSVNAEIARLEAERTLAVRQVTFAQVLFSLREEIVTPAESLNSQFRGAAMTGLTDALTSLSAILLFVISRGPVTLLWVLLVFFPARWMWRKWHPSTVQTSQLPQGA